MSKKRSKIGLIFCGGSGIKASSGKILEVEKKEDIQYWLKELPEIGIIGDIEPYFVFGDDASEVTPEIWKKLAGAVKEIYEDVDGIVITHGIDTIIYTGSMLSFMLQNLGKPVVITSSPLFKEMKSPAELEGLIYDYRNLGVRANLINAFQVATMDIAEVVIMQGNRVLRANQTINSVSPSINVFQEYAEGLLGKVDFGIKLFDHVKKRSKGRLKVEQKIHDEVSTLRLDPTSQGEQLGNLIAKENQALLIRSYSTNLFPNSFRPYLHLANEKGIPIVAYSLHAPEKKKERKEYIVVNNMTYEATLTKYLWALGKSNKPDKIRELLYRNISGEIRNTNI